MTQSMQKTEEDASVAVATGAVILGTADGVMNVAAANATLAGKLLEPGDQRHIPHPVDEFVAAISGARQVLTTPGDMNIKHSVHPIDSALNVHGALVTATTDNFAQQGFVQGLRTSSAATAGVIVGTIDPFKKLKALSAVADVVADTPKAMEILQTGAAVNPMPVSWKTYEHLLGHGSQPPKLKPLRDFSRDMQYEPPEPLQVHSYLEYEPDPNHEIFIELKHDWNWAGDQNIVHTKIKFEIQANPEMREAYGSGAEMFHSALRVLHENNIRVDRIVGDWEKFGKFTTNYDAFADARKQGATVQEAISKTKTGSWAADAGFNKVGGDSINALVDNNVLPRALYPEFTRPVFSDNPAYQTYGEKWASSQGRSRQDLVPRQGMEYRQEKLSTLEQQLEDLSQKQADEILRYIKENFENQPEISGTNIDPEFKR